MDVARLTFLPIATSLLMTACSPPESGTEKFSEKVDNEYCQSQAIKNQYVVKYYNGDIEVIHAEDREEFLKEFVQPNLDRIEIIDQNIQFKMTQPIRISPLTTSSDTWGQNSIHAEEVWEQGYLGEGITVAVIDSGVNVKHPSLRPSIIINSGERGLDSKGRNKETNGIDDDNNGYVDDVSGYNFASNIPNNIENGGHGTHVTGIIGSQHSQQYGEVVYGIAPKAKILPIDFIDEQSGGTIESAVNAIEYVIRMSSSMNIRVINASWGGPVCSSILEDKIAELADYNILFVTAAGNDGLNIDIYGQYPASYKLNNLVTVGAITSYYGMTYFSNYGDSSVDIFAPGEDIFSTVFSNQFVKMDGTSMAAPFVSGAAAVLWSKNPEAHFEDIKRAITNHGQFSPSYRSTTQSRLNLLDAFESL